MLRQTNRTNTTPADREWNECTDLQCKARGPVRMIKANLDSMNGAMVEALWQDVVALSAHVLNARANLREWLRYVACGQVPEDSHAAKRAREILKTPMGYHYDKQSNNRGEYHAGN